MKNLFTPHTPRYKIMLVLVVWLVSWNLTKAQQFKEELSLQPLAKYKESLKLFYNKKWGADRKEFATLNVKGVWHLLPSVGFSFGLPSVSWSVSQYINYKVEKKKVKQQLLSLDARAEIEYLGLLQELESRYIIVQTEIQKLKSYEVKEKFQNQLYQIKKECCDKNECKPEECILNEMNQANFQEQKTLLKMSAIKAVKELEIFAKFNLPKDHIYYNQSECIMDSEEFRMWKGN